ncbi:amidohydrolase family protein [Adhaeretor mobilis]|uniref:amidohydrolase family protein n=1 Tax=Adhaeretor mobilis TaxID=1930276 RepID=UPI001FEB917E|nr:amidohydrolase family protein [Adhaeretor mobilis]
MSLAHAQQPLDGAKLDGTSGRDLALDQFRPKSQLVLPQETVRRAKFPVVDVHVHCRLKMRQSPEVVDEFVRLMDDQNIAVCNSLDGGLGERFDEHKKFLGKHSNRFTIFANIDWIGDGKRKEPATWDCHRPDFGRRMALALADAKQRGAAGLKIHKMLGLYFRNPDGSYIKVDDPRWDPIWEACGELSLPVLIHTADPVAFFQPVDATNERWEELNRHPRWSFSGGPPNNYTGPSHDELLAARNRVFAKHPNTQFIAAHVANYPENLAKVGEWLDTYPNMHVEIAARIAELGRQPRTARNFFLRYQDRILFGTDGPRSPGRLRPHWRLLETDHEYFSYAEGQYPPQGLWGIYGLDLPDKVLRKVYHENAAKLIAGVAERLSSSAFQAE